MAKHKIDFFRWLENCSKEIKLGFKCVVTKGSHWKMCLQFVYFGYLLDTYIMIYLFSYVPHLLSSRI